jgi:transcriptional regulator with XRE-family HTH domain
MPIGGERVRNLERLRKAAGLTQAQLAEMVGVDQATVSRWEQGERSPMIATAFAVANALHCTIDDLLKDV